MEKEMNTIVGITILSFLGTMALRAFYEISRDMQRERSRQRMQLHHLDRALKRSDEEMAEIMRKINTIEWKRD